MWPLPPEENTDDEKWQEDEERDFHRERLEYEMSIYGLD
jgi:hypothetical protein